MTMRNAKKEFIGDIGTEGIECAVIVKGHYDGCMIVGNSGSVNSELLEKVLNDESDLEIEVAAVLEKGYSPEDLTTFLEVLDFDYDSGYGGQEVFGVVLMTDGTWFTRGEYDGAEWWEHHVRPEVPQCCISKS